MTYTGTSFPGYDATYGYVARSLRLLRTAVGPDVRSTPPAASRTG